MPGALVITCVKGCESLAAGGKPPATTDRVVLQAAYFQTLEAPLAAAWPARVLALDADFVNANSSSAAVQNLYGPAFPAHRAALALDLPADVPIGSYSAAALTRPSPAQVEASCAVLKELAPWYHMYPCNAAPEWGSTAWFGAGPDLGAAAVAAPADVRRDGGLGAGVLDASARALYAPFSLGADVKGDSDALLRWGGWSGLQGAGDATKVVLASVSSDVPLPGCAAPAQTDAASGGGVFFGPDRAVDAAAEGPILASLRAAAAAASAVPSSAGEGTPRVDASPASPAARALLLADLRGRLDWVPAGFHVSIAPPPSSSSAGGSATVQVTETAVWAGRWGALPSVVADALVAPPPMAVPGSATAPRVFILGTSLPAAAVEAAADCNGEGAIGAVCHRLRAVASARTPSVSGLLHGSGAPARGGASAAALRPPVLRRVVTGTGLHRDLHYSIDALVKLPPGTPASPPSSSSPLRCELALLQRLERTTYLDLDEVRDQERRSGGAALRAFAKFIDVERPSSSSAQHVVVLAHGVGAGVEVDPTWGGINATLLPGGRGVEVSAAFRTLLHARYQSTGCGGAAAEAAAAAPAAASSCPAGVASPASWAAIHAPLYGPVSPSDGSVLITAHPDSRLGSLAVGPHGQAWPYVTGCYAHVHLPQPSLHLRCGTVEGGDGAVPADPAVAVLAAAWGAALGGDAAGAAGPLASAAWVALPSTQRTLPFAAGSDASLTPPLYPVPIGEKTHFTLVSRVTSTVTLASAALVVAVALWVLRRAGVAGGKAPKRSKPE